MAKAVTHSGWKSMKNVSFYSSASELRLFATWKFTKIRQIHQFHEIHIIHQIDEIR